MEITVTISGSGADRTLTFSESPVRVGRNQLNDIAIDDPFISQWHGLLRFGPEGITYADLGSTNGSIMENVRLSTNVPSRLTERSRIQLGRIELAVAALQINDSGPRRTIAWGHSQAPTATGSGEPAAPGATGARSASSSKPALQPAHARPSDPSPQREHQLLEAFAEGFVGLRKGYEQFGVEVGVRTISGRTALHRARTAQAVLDHLLQPEVPMATVRRDLIGIFADFGIHHIAMMTAVTEGVRALLQSLDPRASELDVGGRLFGGSKAKSKWTAYLERFDQILTEDKELHAAIFGLEFARAYAHATLGDGSKQDEPGEDED